jgi:hypothetical protein
MAEITKEIAPFGRVTKLCRLTASRCNRQLDSVEYMYTLDGEPREIENLALAVVLNEAQLCLPMFMTKLFRVYSLLFG